MTIRLRDDSPDIEYFKPVPQEVLVQILSYYRDEAPIQSYLSAIPCVSKLWNASIHDVTVNLLNSRVMGLLSVTFLSKVSSIPEKLILHTFKYLKFLQGNLSLEELQDSEPLTFKPRPLTCLHLKEIAHLNNLERQQLGGLFSKVERLVQTRCTFKDNAILSKFINLRYLDICPNEYTDLTFIATFPHLQTLYLSFVASNIFYNSILKVMTLTSIIELGLTNTLFQSLEFPSNFQLPDQLKDMTLTNFGINANIFSFSSKIERINLHCSSSLSPDSFKHLKDLKKLFIQPTIERLKLQQLKLESLHIESDLLQELHLNTVTCKTWSTECPKLRETRTINFVTEKFDPIPNC